MKHTLQLRLSQQLTLTPQLQQSIRLLQLSTLELANELDTLLQENPFLERAEAGESDEPRPENGETSETPSDSDSTSTREEAASPEEAPGNREESFDWEEDNGNWGTRESDENDDYPQLEAEPVSLRDHLQWQLGLTQLGERDRRMVSMLIDTLDEDGYLTQNLDELAAMLPPELEIEPIELHTALLHLQNLDPPGVGARDLSECLTLQLDILPADTPCRAEALEIARQHLALLAARDYAKLKKLLRCDDETLRAAQNLITHLNPHPGADFSIPDTRYIQHDVEVKKIKGRWVAQLNADVMPKLRINHLYADILRRNRDSAGQHLASQLQEAKWMIKNVQQRFDTILRVSQAIVERQRSFFDHGAVAMRPLVLREIAETVGLHESTISRVTTQKYMLTPRGIFELKYFFGSHVSTDSGGACSSTAIRALIKQLVAAEEPKKPLSDSQITEVLAQQGIAIARRTVAKYRESLQIPPVNLRKTL